ncbi:MAG: alpha/beta hydrolase, partial [Marmoricola sp.]|nr:alpha/beta hydrolase [Marmoricola sp.]
LTWRLQVPALVEAGYRVVAPDMRGYGASARPSEVEAYRVDVVGADLVGLLDHEGVDRAHVVGHDWGAATVWPLGLTHPERLLSLTGLSVPYAPASPAPPTEIFRRRIGEDFYMLQFQREGAAERLERDVEHTLLRLFDGRLEPPEPGASMTRPDWLPPEVLAEYVETFSRTGFDSALSYYRNLDPNWEVSRSLPDRAIETPAMFVTGTADPVALFMPHDGAGAFRSLEVHRIEGAGHWAHLEAGEQVNALLLDHLARASV